MWRYRVRVGSQDGRRPRSTARNICSVVDVCNLSERQAGGDSVGANPFRYTSSCSECCVGEEGVDSLLQCFGETVSIESSTSLSTKTDRFINIEQNPTFTEQMLGIIQI